MSDSNPESIAIGEKRILKNALQALPMFFELIRTIVIPVIGTVSSFL